MTAHCPDRGQIVVIDFMPSSGREIGKRRPALVMSPKAYNRKVGLVMVCPITTKISGYPFEVSLSTKRTVGAILTDRVMSFDWRARKCSLVENCPAKEYAQAKEKLAAVLGMKP